MKLSGFAWEDLERPEQCIRDEVSVPFETEDWRELSESEVEQRLVKFIDTDRRRGFDLAQAPITRVKLLRIGDADYKMVWTTHQ